MPKTGFKPLICAEKEKHNKRDNGKAQIYWVEVQNSREYNDYYLISSPAILFAMNIVETPLK